MKSQIEQLRSCSPSSHEFKLIENNISKLDKLMKNVRINDERDINNNNDLSRIRYSINDNDKKKIRNYILKSNFVVEPRQIKNSTSKKDNAFECCSKEDFFEEPNIISKQLINYFKQKSFEWKNFSNNLVDTHCHFDMLFPKIKYNHPNMYKYFSDYSFLYMKNFEACINVICHPRNYLNKGK